MTELSEVDQKRVHRGVRGSVEDRWYKADKKTPSANHNKGSRWRARYVNSEGEERTKMFAKKAPAEDWLKAELAGVVRGDGIDPRLSKITVGDVAAIWRAGLASRTPSTRTTYAHLLDSYVLPKWEKTALTKVRHGDVVSWVSDLSAGVAPSVRLDQRSVKEEGDDRGKVYTEGRGKPLAPSTVRQIYKIFSMVLSLAVRNRQLVGNPCDHVPLPRIARSDPRFLTADQVERLASAANYLAALPKRPGARTDLVQPSSVADGLDRDEDGQVIIPVSEMSENGLIIELLSYAGLRAGELFGLQVRRVNLQRCRLDVAAAVVEVNGVVEVGEPKTHQVRSVPIDESFVPLLRDQMAGKSPTDYVFSSRTGGPIRLRNWTRRVFAPAVELAGLGDVTVHDLRHTAASLAISEGADGSLSIKAIQTMLGHSSAAMTLDVYGALLPDDAKPITRRRRPSGSSANRPQHPENEGQQ